MRFWIPVLTITLAIMMLSCGSETDEPVDDYTGGPVYDVAANPQGFPEAALELLRKLEAGRLNTYGQIIHEFGKLYEYNPDMLDNQDWHIITSRLGTKFKMMADQMVPRGVQFYTQAAGYYRLASFARPSDKKIASAASLFDAWTRGMDAKLAWSGPVRDFEDPEEAVSLTRMFLCGDVEQNRFADSLLVQPYLAKLLPSRPDQSSLVDSLEPIDHAFLCYLGFASSAPEPLGGLESLPVEFLPGRLTRTGDSTYRAEIYLRLSESVDVTDALKLRLTLDSGAEQIHSLNWLRPSTPVEGSSTIIVGALNMTAAPVKQAEVVSFVKGEPTPETFSLEVKEK